MSTSREFMIGDALVPLVRLCALAALVALGPAATFVLMVLRRTSHWPHWYLRAAVAGTIVGVPVGGFVALAMQAMAGGLPEPWRMTFIPFGGVVGGAIAAATFSCAVALVHAVSRFATGGSAKASADAADEAPSP